MPQGASCHEDARGHHEGQLRAAKGGPHLLSSVVGSGGESRDNVTGTKGFLANLKTLRERVP